MQTKLLPLALTLALSACASSGPLAPPPMTCPKPPPVAAWILEPAPNLVQMLDGVISPSAMPQDTSKSKSPTAKSPSGN